MDGGLEGWREVRWVVQGHLPNQQMDLQSPGHGLLANCGDLWCSCLIPASVMMNWDLAETLVRSAQGTLPHLGTAEQTWFVRLVHRPRQICIPPEG